MNLEKYTERARGFIQAAQSLAIRETTSSLPEHILKVLLDDEEGLAAGLIDRRRPLARRSRQVKPRSQNCQSARAGAGSFTLRRPRAAFRQRGKIAEKAGDSFVTSSGCCRHRARARRRGAKILANAGVTAQTLNAAINDLRKGAPRIRRAPRTPMMR